MHDMGRHTMTSRSHCDADASERRPVMLIYAVHFHKARPVSARLVSQRQPAAVTKPTVASPRGR